MNDPIVDIVGISCEYHDPVYHYESNLNQAKSDELRKVADLINRDVLPQTICTGECGKVEILKSNIKTCLDSLLITDVEVMGIERDRVYKYQNKYVKHNITQPQSMTIAGLINKTNPNTICIKKKLDNVRNSIITYLDSLLITNVEGMGINVNSTYTYKNKKVSNTLLEPLRELAHIINNKYNSNIHTNCSENAVLLTNIKSYLNGLPADSALPNGVTCKQGYPTFGAVFVSTDCDGNNTETKMTLKQLHLNHTNYLIEWLDHRYGTAIGKIGKNGSNDNLVSKTSAIFNNLEQNPNNVKFNNMKTCDIDDCKCLALNGNTYCTTKHNKCVVVQSHVDGFAKCRNKYGVVIGRQLLDSLIKNYNSVNKKINNLQPKGTISGIESCESLMEVYHRY